MNNKYITQGLVVFLSMAPLQASAFESRFGTRIAEVLQDAINREWRDELKAPEFKDLISDTGSIRDNDVVGHRLVHGSSYSNTQSNTVGDRSSNWAKQIKVLLGKIVSSDSSEADVSAVGNNQPPIIARQPNQAVATARTTFTPRNIAAPANTTGTEYPLNRVVWQWTAVQNADRYEVTIDGRAVGTTTELFWVSENLWLGDHSMTVRAISPAGLVSEQSRTAKIRVVGLAQNAGSSVQARNQAQRNYDQGELIAPQAGSILSGSTVTFEWADRSGQSFQRYLRVGSRLGRWDYVNQRIEDPNQLSYTAKGLPTDGRNLYVEFSYKNTNGNNDWVRETHQFTAATSDPRAAQNDVSGSDAPSAGGAAAATSPSRPAGSSSWDMSVEPPRLDNPLIYSLSNDFRKKGLEDYSAMGCQGRYIRINVPDNRDAVVKMDPRSGAIGYPVWIVGGRHIHVIGLEMRPITQPTCGVGEGHQKKVPQHPNIHPRLPGHMMLRTQNSGVSFFEGVDIDLLGHEADCFVIRNTDNISFSQAKQQRKVYVVNSRCTGFESLDDGPIGDGVHGDIIQNQAEPLGVLVFENTTFRSSGNGITHHAKGGVRLREFSLRNFDFATDWRYTGDDPYDGTSGLAFTVHADNVAFDNVWIEEHRGLNYGMVNKARFGAEYKKGFITRVPEINAGYPPTSEFAPSNRVGLEYTSPFNNPY